MEAKFDKIYKDIVDTIVEKGIWSEGNVRTKYADGTAAHYKSYIGYQFRLDNSDDEAHLITSRFAPSKAPIRELYWIWICLLYTSPSPRDSTSSRMPSSA